MIFQNLNLGSSEIDKVRDIQHPVLYVKAKFSST